MAAINGFKTKAVEEMLMWVLFLFCPSENWVWTVKRGGCENTGRQAGRERIIKTAKPVGTDLQDVLFRYAKDIQKFLQVFNSSWQFL